MSEPMTNEAKAEIIRQAMWGKKSLVCDYGGLSRIFSPHMLGIQTGQETVLVYQFQGKSWSSDTIHNTNARNWRNFRLQEIQNLRPLLDKKGEPSLVWFTHDSYTGTSAGWEKVTLHIPAPDDKDA